ncbi:MAG: hypothetical protein AB1552_12395 [Nitrospirota bacterium]
MSEIRIKALILYLIAVLAAFFLQRVINKISEKAVRDKKLDTGIYHFFPLQGDQAVRLAKGYIYASKIVFWFTLIIFPLRSHVNRCVKSI